jgi:hypothetical protein
VRTCLKMIGGDWSSVTADGDEDITCVRDGPQVVEYAQVKTEEFPTTPWSVASLCEPERGADRSTSILGRLFTGKPLPEAVRFRLIGNVQLQRVLRPLTPEGQGSRAEVETAIVARLGALRVSDGRTVRWCVERLVIEHVAGNADALEAMVVRELEFAALHQGIGLFAHEAASVLEGIIAFVQGTARSVAPAPILVAQMIDEFRRRAAAAISASAAAQAPGAPTLAEKLAAAGVSIEQIQWMQGVHTQFVHAYRSALPSMVATFDNLVDEIRLACVALGLRRREGAIQGGAEMFDRTIAAVRDLHEAGAWATRGVPLLLAHGMLHDITARCQHRYD